MKELLEYVCKSIVNEPEAVSVEEKESQDIPGWTILTIHVAEGDKGIVIGKKGRTINAIRDLITISAIRAGKKARVMLEDDNGPEKKAAKVETKAEVEVAKEEEPDESIFDDDEL